MYYNFYRCRIFYLSFMALKHSSYLVLNRNINSYISLQQLVMFSWFDWNNEREVHLGGSEGVLYGKDFSELRNRLRRHLNCSLHPWMLRVSLGFYDPFETDQQRSERYPYRRVCYMYLASYSFSSLKYFVVSLNYDFSFHFYY